MKKNNLLISTLIALFAFYPLIASAQTPSPSTILPRTSPNVTYNPVSSSDTKKTFSGQSFSSVGGAIAGCANVQGLISGGVNTLFKKQIEKAKAQAIKLGQKIPVDDTSATAELKKANRTKECLDGIAYAVEKKLLQQVSTRTLAWINTGLGGNPFYVQDVSSNLQTIRDEKLQQYLGGAALSNPIFGNAIRSAITKQVTGLSDGYINKAMNTPQGQQYTAFQQDFSNGGWSAFLNMNNNPIGALFSSTDKVEKQITATQTERINEIQRNNGFLDMRQCVEYAAGSETTSLYKYSYNGQQCTTDVGASKLIEYNACVKAGGDINTCNTSSTKTAAALAKTSCIYGSSVPLPTTPQCLRYKTSTPGSIISQQAYTILGSPTRQLELADSINEVLGSFFDKQLNDLYQKGLNALQPRRSGGYGTAAGFGSNVVLGSNGSAILTNSNTFGYSAVGSGYDIQDFDISRPQQLRAITQAQYNFFNRATDSKIIMDTIVPTLGALDYCLPGPNPTWTNGLNENYQSFIGTLETPSKNRPTISTIINSIPVIGGIISSIFGSGSTEVQYALAGQPSLFDKSSGQTIDISPWSYLYYTKDYARGVKDTDGDWIRNYINDGFNRLVKKYQTTFTDASVISLFTAVDPNTSYATGVIKDSLKETANLITYNENLSPLDDTYAQAISDTDDAINELESIRSEELAIIKVAKARYIKERAAIGNPVDMNCINQAYVVDETPIVGVSRQESDILNPIVRESQDASDYFYSHL